MLVVFEFNMCSAFVLPCDAWLISPDKTYHPELKQAVIMKDKTLKSIEHVYLAIDTATARFNSLSQLTPSQSLLRIAWTCRVDEGLWVGSVLSVSPPGICDHERRQINSYQIIKYQINSNGYFCSQMIAVSQF